MNALIETIGGKVIGHGNLDFTNDSRYDSATHTIITNAPDQLIPYNPNHDTYYHVWNGSAFVLQEMTKEEKDHAAHSMSDSVFQDLLFANLQSGTSITISKLSNGKIEINAS